MKNESRKSKYWKRMMMMMKIEALYHVKMKRKRKKYDKRCYILLLLFDFYHNFQFIQKKRTKFLIFLLSVYLFNYIIFTMRTKLYSRAWSPLSEIFVGFIFEDEKVLSDYIWDFLWWATTSELSKNFKKKFELDLLWLKFF